MAEPHIIVLTAPSGAGKTTIAHRVLDAMPEVSFSVSATTRESRPGETDGEDYLFLSTDEFERRVEAGDLLEYEEVYPGTYYGTLRSEVEKKGAHGGVLLDVEVKGARNVKKMYGDDALVLFIAPPSMEELARRLHERGTEDQDSLDDRLDRAEMEMKMARECDAVIINDDLDVAVEETLARIRRFMES